MNEDKSTRYHRRRRRAELSARALVAAVLLLAAASGVSEAARSGARSLTVWLPAALQPGAAAALFLLGLAAAVQALALPFDWFQSFWLERRYGLSSHVMGRWLADHLKAAAVTSVMMAAGLGAVYLSLRYWPDRWWLVSAVVFIAAMVGAARLAPVVLLPLVAQIRPLRRASLSERLVRLADRAGAPVLGAYEWTVSGHTRAANAALAGIGRSRRILLSDTLLEACSDEEIEVVLAHELAHQVHHDLWATMLLQAATLVAGFYVAGHVLGVAAPWLGLHDPADVAGAPVLLLVAGAWSLLMMPLGNALSRAQERRADRYALGLTANPAAFVTAMRRLGQQNLAEDRPSPLARWLFASHPPLRERIAAAEQWPVAPPLPAHGIIAAKE